MNDIWREMLHLRADTTLAVGLILAICMTVHILLSKREVASSVGWIGLVWFAPILGAIAYMMFGVNRVRRLARQFAHRIMVPTALPLDIRPAAADGLDRLERGIGRITGRPLLAGTEMAIFQNGDAAYPPMLAAIAAATSSVGLSSYIFRDDVWGGRFIGALTDATATRRRRSGTDRRSWRRLADLARV